jgi:NAD(P)-dependent dehydrogenase (short-subunit alcohol dehydrogenase family)
MSLLANTKVVVVGGTSGIGLGVARAAAAAGAEVTVASRSAGSASLGSGITARALDMADESAVAGFFDNLGSFDHLVITATGGPLRFGSVVATPAAEIRPTFDNRFWGTYNVVRSAAPHLRPTGRLRCSPADWR